MAVILIEKAVYKLINILSCIIFCFVRVTKKIALTTKEPRFLVFKDSRKWRAVKNSLGYMPLNRKGGGGHKKLFKKTVFRMSWTPGSGF